MKTDEAIDSIFLIVVLMLLRLGRTRGPITQVSQESLTSGILLAIGGVGSSAKKGRAEQRSHLA